MSSIVLDLQNEVTSSDCDIVNVLRKAHMIAIKLGLKEFDHWVSCELNGYHNHDDIPDYRNLRGQLKAFNPFNGWIPAMIPDRKTEKLICEHKIPNSVSEIITLCNQSGSGLIISFTGEMQEALSHMFEESLPMEMALHISNAAARDVVEKVKNTVLEWTLRLEEEGILGEGMTFDEKEKYSAQSIPQTVNNYYGATNVISGSTENLQVVSGDNNSVAFTYEKVRQAVEEIQKAINEENITDEDKETAIELLSDIRTKLDSETKPSIIKAALVALKDFLVNASGSLAAALVQAKIQGLF